MFITPYQHRFQRWTRIDNRMVAARQPAVDLVVADINPIAQVLPIVIPARDDALPQALITPTDQNDPFAGHTPRLWEEYPFSLVPDSLGIDSEGQPTYHDALWADPTAPHWQQHAQVGYRLFDDEGQPTEALRDVIQRLRQMQEEVQHTRAMVALLAEAQAFVTRRLEHRGQMVMVYQVVTDDGLGKRLEALDRSLAGRALLIAETLKASQESLTFQDVEPWHWDRIGVL